MTPATASLLILGSNGIPSNARAMGKGMKYVVHLLHGKVIREEQLSLAPVRELDVKGSQNHESILSHGIDDERGHPLWRNRVLGKPTK